MELFKILNIKRTLDIIGLRSTEVKNQGVHEKLTIEDYICIHGRTKLAFDSTTWT